MSNPIPEKPRCVLRLAIAGNRKLLEGVDRNALTATIDTTLAAVAHELATLHAKRDHPVYRYWSDAKPLLRTLSGLADGIDQLAVQRALAINSANAPVDVEHVAVLPFQRSIYRDRSPVVAKDTFDALIADAAAVVELDGTYRADPDPAAAGAHASRALAKRSRGRAYRAQSVAMLARADVLLAVIDLTAAAKAGGTRETIRSALDIGMPAIVIALEPAGPRRYVVRRAAQLASIELASDDADLATDDAVRAVIAQLVGDGRDAPPQRHDDDAQKVDETRKTRDTLSDYFNDAVVDDRDRQRLKRRWERFLRPFRENPGENGGGGDEKPFGTLSALRGRARRLTYAFMDRYRGGFIANFHDAATAGMIAVIALLALASTFMLLHQPVWCPASWSCPPPLEKPPLAFKLALLALAGWKLRLVLGIKHRTEKAKEDDWNDRAIQARYLTETLRLMTTLPALGYARAPERLGEHLAETTLRRSAVDWLLHAAVRALPNSDLPQQVSAGSTMQALVRLKDGWLRGQLAYHEKNAAEMRRMQKQLDASGTALAKNVVIVVVADIVLLVLGVLFKLPSLVDIGKFALIATAAILPVRLASTNGIREQTECHRLAERSLQMHAQLAALSAQIGELIARIKKAQEDASSDPGAWSLEALELAENCACLVADEVSEWSVLYSKQLLDG